MSYSDKIELKNTLLHLEEAEKKPKWQLKGTPQKHSIPKEYQDQNSGDTMYTMSFERPPAARSDTATPEERSIAVHPRRLAAGQTIEDFAQQTLAKLNAEDEEIKPNPKWKPEEGVTPPKKKSDTGEP